MAWALLSSIYKPSGAQEEEVETAWRKLFLWCVAKMQADEPKDRNAFQSLACVEPSNLQGSHMATFKVRGGEAHPTSVEGTAHLLGEGYGQKEGKGIGVNPSICPRNK